MVHHAVFFFLRFEDQAADRVDDHLVPVMLGFPSADVDGPNVQYQELWDGTLHLPCQAPGTLDAADRLGVEWGDTADD